MNTFPPLDAPTPRQYHFKQCGWLPHTLHKRRLLSLFQMLEVGAYGYIAVGVAIQLTSDNLTVSLAPEELLTATAKAEVRQALLTILGHCGKSQLIRGSSKQTNKRVAEQITVS